MFVEKMIEVVKFAETYGDPYETQLTLEWTTPHLVVIRNLTGKFTREQYRQVEDYLIREGVKKVTWFRRKRDGTFKEIVRNI